MSERPSFEEDYVPDTEPLDLDLLRKLDQLEVDPAVQKSRQVEQQKRAHFQSLLNKILLWLVLLLIVLLLFMFVL